MAPVSDGEQKESLAGKPRQADAPSAHRRPGYSSSGCTPAEPDSASPGNGNFTLAKKETQRTRENPEVTRSRFTRFHVKTESGTQVASRGPTWRIATPPV